MRSAPVGGATILFCTNIVGSGDAVEVDVGAGEGVPPVAGLYGSETIASLYPLGHDTPAPEPSATRNF